MPLSAFQNTFAGNPLDRAGDRRADAAWLAAQLAAPGARAVALWNGRPLVAAPNDGSLQIAYLPAAMAEELSGGAERLLFLGLSDGEAVFAVDLEGGADPAEGPLQGLGRFADLRASAGELPGAEAAHCAACGEPSDVADGGWKRVCPACKAEHFPRTDPVVIMLPVFGERCMLGRQEIWPKGMFSALAGFLEPGESIEEACARELAEEAGLSAVSVRYHSTQPWPYPSSLMIGLIAEVSDDQATPDQTELSAVRWFTRDEARQVLEGGFDGVFAPPPMAIAHQLLKAWVEEG
jgi:NAD+ diphosphatase